MGFTRKKCSSKRTKRRGGTKRGGTKSFRYVQNQSDTFKNGRMYYTNGDIYYGKMKQGLRHGQGEITYANGDIYDGEWENDKRHGQGEITYANGDRYDGEWQNDKRHGQGVLYKKDLPGYENMWFDDTENFQAINEDTMSKLEKEIEDAEKAVDYDATDERPSLVRKRKLLNTLETTWSKMVEPKKFDLMINFYSISNPRKIKFTLYAFKKMPISRSFICHLIRNNDESYENKGCINGININMELGDTDIEFKPIGLWDSLDLKKIEGRILAIVYSFNLPELKES